jgi:tripartite-type tricarboxylate transporter receptor subunit TctC
MMANSDVPAKNLAELAELARRGSNLSYGSWGPGSFAHLLAEGLKSKAAINMVHVPYRGAAPAIQDLAAKQISVSFGPVSLASQLMQRGQVRVLALTGEQQSPQLLGVETFVSQGYTDPLFRSRLWVGLAAPRGIPQALSRKIVSELHAVLAQPDIVTFLRNVGFEVIANSPEQFAQAYAAEFPIITKMIRDLNVEMQ